VRLFIFGTWTGAWEDIAAEIPEDQDDLVILHLDRTHRDAQGVERSADWLAGWIARGLGIDEVEIEAQPKIDPVEILRHQPDRALAFGSLRRGGKVTETGRLAEALLRKGVPVRWTSAPGKPPEDLPHDQACAFLRGLFSDPVKGPIARKAIRAAGMDDAVERRLGVAEDQLLALPTAEKV
jgi:hypothetical protein